MLAWASVLSPEVAATGDGGGSTPGRASRRGWRGRDEGRQTLALEVLAATVPTEIARITDALERQVVGFPVEP